jgi:hypothetical protein
MAEKYEMFIYKKNIQVHMSGGLDSLVSIVTGYRLDGLGIKPWWGQDFLHVSRPVLGPTQLPVQYNGYQAFPGGKAAGAWC